MTFLDFFAGVGGFRRGLELAGHKCVGFCEFDKFANASYRSMHTITEKQREYLSALDLKKRQKEILKDEYLNGEWFADDIRTVYAGDIPRADIWCFGFPCQDISVAGHQKGFTGNRSSLFFRVMYLLGQQEEEKKPSLLFIENVKNLLSVNGGWDFARLLVALDEGGYDAEWDVLNSKHFGVPQNRERCFIIGHLRGRSSAEVFPVEVANGADNIYGIGHRNGYRRNTQIFDRGGITEALDTGQGGGRGHHTIEVIGHDPKRKVHDSDRVMDIGGGITNTPSQRLQGTGESRCIVVGNTNPSGKGMNGNCYFSEGLNPSITCNKNEGNRIASPVIDPARPNKTQNGRRLKEDGDESFTLTGQDRHGVAIGPIETNGYNATLKAGGSYTDSTRPQCQRLQRSVREQPDDDSSNLMFAIDKGFRTEERTVANCIEARENRGLSRRKQEGTLICMMVSKSK